MGNAFGKKKTQPGVVTAQVNKTASNRSAGASGQTFKVLWIGEAGVGKTSLIIRLCDGAFAEGGSNVSLGSMDFKMMNAGGNQYQLWDTGGQVSNYVHAFPDLAQERFRTITSSYYRGANVAVVVIDLTHGDRCASACMSTTSLTTLASYFNCQTWFAEIERYASERCPTVPSTVAPTGSRRSGIGCYKTRSCR